jgi:hypothetical protein
MKEIPKDDLEEFSWYVGEGRFSGSPCLGFWTGHNFVGLSFEWGRFTFTDAEYGERGFSPVKSVTRV